MGIVGGMLGAFNFGHVRPEQGWGRQGDRWDHGGRNGSSIQGGDGRQNFLAGHSL